MFCPRRATLNPGAALASSPLLHHQRPSAQRFVLRPKIDDTRTTPTATLWKQGFNQPPFGIRQIACIALPITAITGASDLGPRQVVLLRSFVTTMESQLTEITQLFSGQSLRMSGFGSRVSCEVRLTPP